MKKFLIAGAILASVAVFVLLACTQVFTQTKGGTKKMRIMVDAQTGVVDPVTDDTGKAATLVTQTQLDGIYQKQGFKHVGVILHAESSPGCAYYCSGGKCYKVCH